MRDNTETPTSPGVFVDRAVNSTHGLEGYVHTLQVAESLFGLSERTGIPTDEIERWWFETHSERLIVVD